MKKEKDESMLHEANEKYGFKHLSEDEKLMQDMLRSDSEKFRLFTQMLRRNSLLKKASIQHKSHS